MTTQPGGPAVMTTIGNLRIGGREFLVSELPPQPRAGRAFLLHGPRGAAYLAVRAYENDKHTYKVISGRSWTELRIQGNAVRLTDRAGELEEAR